VVAVSKSTRAGVALSPYQFNAGAARKDVPDLDGCGGAIIQSQVWLME
jgi:hypothetical protein